MYHGAGQPGRAVCLFTPPTALNTGNVPLRSTMHTSWYYQITSYIGSRISRFLRWNVPCENVVWTKLATPWSRRPCDGQRWLHQTLSQKIQTIQRHRARRLSRIPATPFQCCNRVLQPRLPPQSVHLELVPTQHPAKVVQPNVGEAKVRRSVSKT